MVEGDKLIFFENFNWNVKDYFATENHIDEKPISFYHFGTEFIWDNYRVLGKNNFFPLSSKT